MVILEADSPRGIPQDHRRDFQAHAGWAASSSNSCAARASTCCSSSFTLRLLKAGAMIVRSLACSLPSCETSHPGEPRIESGVNYSGGIPAGRNAETDSTALASS